MARIKVSGKYYNVDDVVLDIPGICKVDFMNGVVTRIPENAQSKIEGRLIVLLNYLYQQDGYTSLDTIINDLFDGYAAEGSIKADINNLRKRIFDSKDENGDYRIIQNARGRGYKLSLPSQIAPSNKPNDDEDDVEGFFEDEGTVTNGGGYRHTGPDGGVEELPVVPAMLVRFRTGDTYFIQKLLTRIGSSRYPADSVDLVLSDNEHINRVHAEIRSGGKFFFLSEPNVTLTTQVDGHVLTEGEPVQLGECSEIILADELFFFLSGHACETVSREGKLYAVCSKDTGETRLLLDKPLLMDRHHPWRQSVLRDNRISRSNQARLYREAGATYILDTGSKNGTWCNRRCLAPGEATVLKSGDSLSIVETVFSYYEVALI